MSYRQLYYDLSAQIDTLTKLYQQTESHISDSISWFVALFVGLLAIGSVALSFWARQSIKRGVTKACSDLDKRLLNLQKQIDDITQITRDFENFYEGYRIIDGEREYFAPPMSLGIPYRTTEKIFGNQSIYTLLIDFGFVPSGTTKTVDCPVKDVSAVIRSSVICNGDHKITFYDAKPSDHGIFISITNESEYPLDGPHTQAYVQVWYTKIPQSPKS